jgi:hypothetical protein
MEHKAVTEPHSHTFQSSTHLRNKFPSVPYCNVCRVSEVSVSLLAVMMLTSFYLVHHYFTTFSPSYVLALNTQWVAAMSATGPLNSNFSLTLRLKTDWCLLWNYGFLNFIFPVKCRAHATVEAIRFSGRCEKRDRSGTFGEQKARASWRVTSLPSALTRQ